MLEGNLYSLVSKSIDGTKSAATTAGSGVVCGSAIVRLLAESTIYKAHFPVMAITPGVCLVRIATELINKLTDCEYVMTGSESVKFLSPVLPSTTETLKYVFELSASNDDLKAKVEIFDGTTKCAKMSLTYVLAGSKTLNEN